MFVVLDAALPRKLFSWWKAHTGSVRSISPLYSWEFFSNLIEVSTIQAADYWNSRVIVLDNCYDPGLARAWGERKAPLSPQSLQRWSWQGASMATSCALTGALPQQSCSYTASAAQCSPCGIYPSCSGSCCFSVPTVTPHSTHVLAAIRGTMLSSDQQALGAAGSEGYTGAGSHKGLRTKGQFHSILLSKSQTFFLKYVVGKRGGAQRNQEKYTRTHTT